MVEKIAFLCPVAQVFNPKVVQHTIAMVAYASARGYEVQQVGVVERMLIHQARNVLAEGFMRTECDWAFWMDSDMLMPADTIVKLVEQAKKLDTKFMTGVYYQRLGEHLPVLWRKKPNPDGRNARPPSWGEERPEGRPPPPLHYPDGAVAP
jgi:hypothetical protein